jgi:hypothetical protein
MHRNRAGAAKIEAGGRKQVQEAKIINRRQGNRGRGKETTTGGKKTRIEGKETRKGCMETRLGLRKQKQ